MISIVQCWKRSNEDLISPHLQWAFVFQVSGSPVNEELRAWTSTSAQSPTEHFMWQSWPHFLVRRWAWDRFCNQWRCQRTTREFPPVFVGGKMPFINWKPVLLCLNLTRPWAQAAISRTLKADVSSCFVWQNRAERKAFHPTAHAPLETCRSNCSFCSCCCSRDNIMVRCEARAVCKRASENPSSTYMAPQLDLMSRLQKVAWSRAHFHERSLRDQRRYCYVVPKPVTSE